MTSELGTNLRVLQTITKNHFIDLSPPPDVFDSILDL